MSETTITTFKYEHCWEAAAKGDLDELRKMHCAGFPLQ